MVEFYLLTFPRFPLRKKEHKSYFGKNRTHDFRTTSRCAGYLLYHSGDDGDQKVREKIFSKIFMAVRPFLTRIFFRELFGLEGSKHFFEKFRQVHNLKISDRLLRSKSFVQKHIPGFVCSVCVPFLGS